jgi:hypothetical protein
VLLEASSLRRRGRNLNREIRRRLNNSRKIIRMHTIRALTIDFVAVMLTAIYSE